MQFLTFLSSARPPLIQQSLDALAAMLDVSGRMFAAATATLLDNEALALDLAAEDEVVNAHERAIRQMVLEHVSSGPRDEVALSLVLVSIVQDAERLGDLAKNLGKTADLAGHPRMGPHVEVLRPVRDRVQAAFPRVRDAFVASDEAAAREVMNAHDRTKDDLAAYVQRLAAADDLSPNLGVVLATAGRMIGRTSAHLSNIASGVAVPFDQIRRSPTWGGGGGGVGAG